MAAASRKKMANVMIRQRGVENPDIEDILEDIYDGKQRIVSFEGSSQYGDSLNTRISPSTCGLAALNFARVAFELENQRYIQGPELLAEILSLQTVTEVISICDYWESDSHLEIEELLKVPVFWGTLSLHSCTYSNASKSRFRDLLQDMAKAPPDRSVVAIITRPPEILACLKTRIANKDVYVIFDSHPRPNHPDGLGFIINPTIQLAASYLSDLLAFDETILKDSSDLQWQAQLLGHFSGHILLPVDDEPAINEVLIESSVTVLSAYADTANERSRNADLRQRIEELENEQRLMEDKMRRLEQQKREDHEKYKEALLSKGRGFERDSHSRQAALPDHRQNFAHPKNSSSVTRVPEAGPSGSRRISSDSNGSDDDSQTLPRKEKGKRRADSDSSRNSLSFAGRRSQDTASSYKDRLPSQRRGWPQATTTMPERHSQASLVTPFDRDAAVAIELQREFEEENRRLAAQMRALMQTAPLTFECSICFDEHPEDYVARVDSCDHSFCRDCLRGYVCSKISERRFPILCPVCATEKDKDDQGVISQAIIQQIGVSDEEYNIFEELQLTSFCIPLHCRRCDKTMFLDREEVQETKVIVCPWPNCRYRWCKGCQQQVEDGGPEHSCDGTNELQHLMQQQGWKNCPGCTTPVQRTVGCNRMTCIAPACNTQFCYIDGEMIIKGGTAEEQRAAINRHYSRCRYSG